MKKRKKIIAIGLVITILGQITSDFFVNASEIISQDNQSVESIIAPEDITVSQKELNPGDEVTIRLDKKNVYYGETVTVVYLTPKGEEYFDLDYNWEKGCFEHTYVIPFYAKNGVYQVHQLYSSEFNIFNSKLTESGGVDLSGGDFTVTGGIVDNEAPIIDASSLKITPKIANPGDSVFMQLNVIDNIAVDIVELYYTNEIENHSWTISMEYNEKTGFYENNIEIDHFTPNGTYQLNKIDAYDVLGNHTIITDIRLDNSDNMVEDLSQGDFTVEGAVPDYDAPVIDFNSFKINKKVVKPGDIVTVEAKVSDSSKIAYFNGQYYGQSYQASSPHLEFKLDESTGVYKASFEVTEDFSNGLYELGYIEVSDEHWNIETYDTLNLDNVSFTVEGARPEFNAPEINLDSINVNKETVGIGEKIKFSLFAQDDTAVKSVFMGYYNHEVDASLSLELKYNATTNLYELEYAIPKEMSEGLWELGYVSAVDTYGKYVFYYDRSSHQNWVDTYYDLSAADFTVTPPTENEDGMVSSPVAPVEPNFEDERIQIKFEDSQIKLEQNGDNYIISNIKDRITKIKFTTGQTSLIRSTDDGLIVITVKLNNNAKNFSVNGIQAINGEVIVDLIEGTNVYPLSLLDASGKVIETYSFEVKKNISATVTPPTGDGDDTVTPPTGDGDDTVTPPTENGDATVTPPTENGDDTVTPPTGNGDDTVTPPTGNGDDTVTPPTENGDDTVTPPTGNGDEENKDNTIENPETGITMLGFAGTGVVFIGVGSIINICRRNRK